MCRMTSAGKKVAFVNLKVCILFSMCALTMYAKICTSQWSMSSSRPESESCLLPSSVDSWLAIWRQPATVHGTGWWQVALTFFLSRRTWTSPVCSFFRVQWNLFLEKQIGRANCLWNRYGRWRVHESLFRPGSLNWRSSSVFYLLPDRIL